jgi:predicted AAA+ superfamily ATPase
VKNQDLNDILETYFEIVNFNPNEKYYLFLDEIQEVENWEKFIAKINNLYNNIEIILT